MTKRRARGDGGLGQRHDHASCPKVNADGTRPDHRCRGRWVGKAVVIVNGKKRYKYVYARTERGARVKLATLLADSKSGRVLINVDTLEAWMTEWLTDIASRKLKPQTLAGYMSKNRTLIAPHLGALKLNAITPRDLRAWHDTLRARGGRGDTPLSEASVRQAHAILSKALKTAVREGRIHDNPCDRVDPPATTTTAREAHTLEEAAAILNAAGMSLRWWLAVMYGLRQGEALGLQWGDLTDDTLTINRTLQIGPDRKPVYGLPKTQRSRRTMPLLDPIALRVKAHRPAGAGDDELVFPGVMPWTDSKAWRDLLASADVRRLPLHSARHTAASVLEAAGVPDRLIMQILGHSQVRTTHGYTHAELERVRGALGKALDVLELG